MSWIEIEPDGGTVFWDYLGDAHDRGPNCHLRLEGARLVALGQEEYAAEIDGERLEGTATFRRDGAALFVSGADALDEDADGDVVEIVTERLEAVPGLSTTDFAECTEEDLRHWAESADPATGGEGRPLADPRRPRRLPGFGTG